MWDRGACWIIAHFLKKKKFDADVCGARVGTNGGRVWLGACAGLPAGVTAPAHRAMAMEEATDEAAAAVGTPA